MSTVSHWVEVATLVGFVAILVGSNAFILFYGLFVRWNEKPFGRHLFTFMFVLTASFDHSGVLLFYPNYPGQEWAWLVLCWLFAWVVWWRLKILVRVQIGRQADRIEIVEHEGK